MGFQGSVESFSLADVFQNLAMNQQSGTLRVFVPNGSSERHILFETGQVKYVSHGSDKPLLLGEILVGRGAATQEQVAQALEKQTESGQALGACLVDLGFQTQEQVDQLVRHQIEEEIYDLFGWEKAQFEFIDGPPPKGLFVDQPGQTPSLPISSLIMEAARRVDEWDRLKQEVPSFKEVYTINRDAKAAVASGELGLEAIEQRVMSLIDGTRDVDDVIQDSFLFRYEVLTAIAGFLRDSLIVPAAPEELKEAANRLKEEGNNKQLCKVLERLLASGGDNPKVRAALAESLASNGQTEKAAIHFTVLAESDLKAGREEEAVALYRRILQLLPQHAPSRERMGAIYARRGQKREAVIQYQELMHAYQANAQHAEARTACLRALECEPQSVELREQLIQIYVEGNDRESAAKQHELLGDQLARAGQTKAAADHYRKAMQLMPSQAHLKKKLAGVMLTAEDRRARTKRTLIAGGVAAGVLALAGLLAFYEFTGWQALNRMRSNADALKQEARAHEDKRRFREAMEKYNEIDALYRQSGLPQRFSPALSIAQKAQVDLEQIKDLIQEANLNFLKLADSGARDSKADLEEADKAERRSDYYASRDLLKKVIDNEFADPADKDSARKHLAEIEKLIKTFEDGRARKDFRSVEEEFAWKNEFQNQFGAMPQFPKDFEKPLVLIVNVDGAGVHVDGQLKGVADRPDPSKPQNVIRYRSVGKAHTIKIAKEGFKPFSFGTLQLGLTMRVHLDREPAMNPFLISAVPNGNPAFDGRSLWLGTVDGKLLQFSPEDLADGRERPSWTFDPRIGGKGLLSQVQGFIHMHIQASTGKKFLMYATGGGYCVVCEEGQEKPVVPVMEGSKDQLPAPAMVLNLSILALGKPYFVVPEGNRVRVFDPFTGQPLWNGKPSAELPAKITAPPSAIRNGDLIVVGCANGKLYAIDVRDGRLKPELTWSAGDVRIVTQPIETDNHMIAGDSEGKFFKFSVAGGVARGRALTLGGTPAAFPVMQRHLLFVGTQTGDGFFVVDTRGMNATQSFTGDQIGGSVTQPALVSGEYVYYGTEAGQFYALRRKENEDDRYELAWSFVAPNRIRLVGTPLKISAKRVVFIQGDGRIFAFDE